MESNSNSIDWALILAHIKYWLWWIASKICLGVVCMGIVAEGLRIFVPALGQKLYRLPFLGFLKNYQETYSLDIAPFLALFFMGAVWFFLEKLIYVVVTTDIDVNDSAVVGITPITESEAKFIFALGTVLVGMDAILFYAAAATMTWGGSILSITALLATAGYLGVLIFVSYFSVKLHREVEKLDQCHAKREKLRHSLELGRQATLASQVLSLPSSGETPCATTQPL